MLDTLAVRGGIPSATSNGNVIRVPAPTIVLTAPARTPAPSTRSIPRTVSSSGADATDGAATEGVDPSSGADPRSGAVAAKVASRSARSMSAAHRVALHAPGPGRAVEHPVLAARDGAETSQ